MSILLNSNNVWIPNLDYFLESKTSDINLNEGKYLILTNWQYVNANVCKILDFYSFIHIN